MILRTNFAVMQKDNTECNLGHCYYFLCFSLPARVAFSENTKKKKIPSIKLLPARARSSLASACNLHGTAIENRTDDGNQEIQRHFQVVAWTTKIVKGSSFKLQSSWGRSINWKR